MVRDGRASVHSMISRQVTIAGFNLSSYRDCLSKWSQAIEVMLFQCTNVGSTRCMSIRYENLVLRPRTTMERVLEFLNVPWHEGVLHHEEAIGQPGGVSLSRSVYLLKGIFKDTLAKNRPNLHFEAVHNCNYLCHHYHCHVTMLLSLSLFNFCDLQK